MKLFLILVLLLCFAGCSEQAGGNENVSSDMAEETITATTTTPKITTTETTTMATTTSSSTTTTSSNKVTTKPVTTMRKQETTTPVVTTTVMTTTTPIETTVVTTTTTSEPLRIDPYYYKAGILSKTNSSVVIPSYVVYKANRACKWYVNGEIATENQMESFVIKKGKNIEVQVQCIDSNNYESNIIKQKLNIKETPVLSMKNVIEDGNPVAYVYANEPVYWVINGEQENILKTSIKLIYPGDYKIHAVDEEGHISEDVAGKILNDEPRITTTEDCGCVYRP